MSKNRELHELLGLHICEIDRKLLRCKCGAKGQVVIPNYTADPRLVLREMRKRADFCYIDHHREDDFISMVGLKTGPTPYILLNFILDTSGLLRDAAISFLKGEGR